VPLGLFVIPLLVFGCPNLPLATLATSEWLIEIIIWKVSVSIDV
jgi:hypothetical protein